MPLIRQGRGFYIEASEDVNVAETPAASYKDEDDEEETLTKRDGSMNKAIQKFKSIEGTIRAYTT